MKYLIAPFRTVTKRQIIVWIIAALMIAILDYMGMCEMEECDRMDSNEPLAHGALFHFVGFVGMMLITFPLGIVKMEIVSLIFDPLVTGISPNSPFAQFSSSMPFQMGFDILICSACFVAWRIMSHLWKVWPPKTTLSPAPPASP
jgi:hypothetical protein